MNLCFIKGKVIEEVEFKFCIDCKKISVARTKIELENKSIVTVKGYDEMADWMYQNLGKGEQIYIQGKIDSLMEIEVAWMKVFKGLHIMQP